MFELGREYVRRDIHALFGGQVQGGISTPSQHKIVLLFSSDAGETHGYCDGWDRETGQYLYSGEGQRGDMTFTRGNKAIRDHAYNGKTLHLFEKSARGRVRYIGEMAYVDHRLTEQVVDTDGRSRTAIVFRLQLIGPILPVATAS